ncbi:MAG TPA: radical SAM protein [Patescibacteria group bacterium]|nr:radical SAM protein [Patescibacteria group bacterium]
MSLRNNGEDWLEGLTNGLGFGARILGRIGPVRKSFIKAYDQHIRSTYENLARASGQPTLVEQRRDMALAILHTMDRAVTRDLLGPATLKGTLNIIAREILFPETNQQIKADFIARNDCLPPGLLVISPTKACNLHCSGCYADSNQRGEKLDWLTLQRIIDEAKKLWGTNFFVISGGEPFLYQDQKKGILDLVERNQDVFFQLFTNGTLIDEGVAQRLGKAGNVTPGISIEGLKETTNRRRGPGVFDKVVNTMDLLNQARVPFGVSITATRANFGEILSDQTLNFFFEEMGALYGWLFQYMPIGRTPDLSLMPTPKQRLFLFQRMWETVRNKQYFLADFWNSGVLSDGCIAAGGRGGYLHVDWNGNVAPCVFMPYSPINIKNAFAQGKNLNDIWAEPFFAALRKWQQDYNPGFNSPQPHPNGNLLRPCPIRDHYREFRQLLDQYQPQPIDENARQALEDPDYQKGMEKFDRKWASLVDPIWKKDYSS